MGKALCAIAFLLLFSVSYAQERLKKAMPEVVDIAPKVPDGIEKTSQKAALGDPIAAAQLSDYFFYNYDIRAGRWTLVAAENGYPDAEFREYNLLRVSRRSPDEGA